MKFARFCLFTLLLFLCVGCASGHSESAAEPTPTPTLIPVPPIPRVPAQNVFFNTTDNIRLSGLLYGKGETWVICSHMNNSDKTTWGNNTGLPQRLATLGYTVLAYDFRGFGLSEGHIDLDKLDTDLQAAINYAKQQKATQIVLLGASMGGTATLQVASKEPVTAVISLSTPQIFGKNVSDEQVKAIKVPKLFMAGVLDEPYASDAKHMSEIASAPKELYLYPTNDHGISLFRGDNGDDPALRILHFIQQYAPLAKK